MAKKEDKALTGAASGAAAGSVAGPWGAVIGGAIGGIGGLLSGDDDDGSAERARIAEIWDRIYAPTQDDLAVNYNDFSYAGDIDPRMLTAEQLSMRDNLQDVNLDPRLRQAQMQSLETLGKIAGSGFTPDELASLESSRMQRESDLTSRMKQLQQQQDARGVGSSDMALAQRMMEAQGAANRGAADARAQEAEAYKRSLQAIMNQGTLAGNMESSDYQRGANLANSLNQRELTNLNQRAQTNTSNVDAFNRALESNRNMRQDVLNKNTATRNSNMDANSQAYDRAYRMQADKAAGQAGGARTSYDIGQNQQARKDNMWSGVVQGGIGAVANYLGKSPASNTTEDNKIKLGTPKNNYGTPE